MALIGALLWAVRSPKFEFSRLLLATASLLLFVFLFLPRIIFGSEDADMRLTPYILMMALLAIRPKPDTDRKWQDAVALLSLTFFVIRIGAHCISFYQLSERHERALLALDHLPHGARMVAFVGPTCEGEWGGDRLDHLPSLAIVRRDAFSNDQWAAPGAQLLRIRKNDAPGFVGDPSQFVTPGNCRTDSRLSLDKALEKLPRAAFDYVWLLDPPPFKPENLRNMRRVWTNGTDSLYRI